MNKKTILHELETNDSFVASCLNTLHEHPSNGFRRTDLNLLKVARRLTETGNLTPSQLRLARKKLRTYVHVLLTCNLTCPTSAKQKKTYTKHATLYTPKTLLLEFPATDLETRQFIKTKIHGRKYNQTVHRAWTAPAIHDNIEKLRVNGFKLSNDVQQVWNSFYPTPTTLKKTMPVYDFQHEGVEFLIGANGRGIIGDEMGLGKTIQALYWLHHTTNYPVLIISPKSVKLNWAAECAKWLPDRSVQIITGKKHVEITGDIVLINCDIIAETQENLKNVCTTSQGAYTWKKKKVKQGVPRPDLAAIPFKACIVDELHNFKNENARRTQALQKLVKPISNLIGLSGTPIKNRPIEFFPFLKLIDPKKWSHRRAYAIEFCNAQETMWGWNDLGASNLKKLHAKLKGTMLRRLKHDVLPQLPPKTRSVIPIEITKKDQQLYLKLENSIRSQLLSINKRAGQLALLEQLKQLTIDIKLPYCIDWIEDYLAAYPKLVVFVHHRAVLQTLQDHFKQRCVCISGGDSQIKREQAIDTFQNNSNIEIFVGSIMATKEGITLTAAKDTVTLEFVWDPAAHLQAENRVHRIGQESDNVGAYYPVLPNSIDIVIARLLDEKIKILSQILDGKQAGKTDLFLDLLKEYRK